MEPSHWDSDWKSRSVRPTLHPLLTVSQGGHWDNCRLQQEEEHPVSKGSVLHQESWSLVWTQPYLSICTSCREKRQEKDCRNWTQSKHRLYGVLFIGVVHLTGSGDSLWSLAIDRHLLILVLVGLLGIRQVAQSDMKWLCAK